MAIELDYSKRIKEAPASAKQAAAYGKGTVGRKPAKKKAKKRIPKAEILPPSTKRAPDGKFLEGEGRPEGSGRETGTPNRTTTVLKEAILHAASLVGEPKPIYSRKKDGKIIAWISTGNEELVGYLKFLALEHPAVFGQLLGKVLPLQVHAKIDETVEFVDARERVRVKIENLSQRLEGTIDSLAADSGATRLPIAVGRR